MSLASLGSLGASLSCAERPIWLVLTTACHRSSVIEQPQLDELLYNVAQSTQPSTLTTQLAQRTPGCILHLNLCQLDATGWSDF